MVGNVKKEIIKRLMKKFMIVFYRYGGGGEVMLNIRFIIFDKNLLFISL